MAKRAKKQERPQLTPNELAALDFVIKDMEEQGELQVGIFPAAAAAFVARAILRAIVAYLVKRLLDRLAGTGRTPAGLSQSQMREAELSDLSEMPSLAELKKIRQMVTVKKSK